MKIDLWEENVPYYNENYGQKPYLTPYIAEGAKECVIVCPGGGYFELCHDREGEGIAKMFNQNGISAYVLDYRIKPYHNPAMLEDILRSVRVVRREANTYGYDPEKIAVLGFSAGGHLASMALTHFDYGRADGDETDKLSSRPNMGILCYPVITMGEYTHRGTRENLLGDDWDNEAMRNKFSSEKAVRDDTPPCFIFHTAIDTCVPVENSLMMAQALMKKKIPVELHIFQEPDHGMGLGANPPVHAAQWTTLCVNAVKNWLK